MDSPYSKLVHGYIRLNGAFLPNVINDVITKYRGDPSHFIDNESVKCNTTKTMIENISKKVIQIQCSKPINFSKNEYHEYQFEISSIKNYNETSKIAIGIYDDYSIYQMFFDDGNYEDDDDDGNYEDNDEDNDDIPNASKTMTMMIISTPHNVNYNIIHLYQDDEYSRTIQVSTTRVAKQYYAFVELSEDMVIKINKYFFASDATVEEKNVLQRKRFTLKRLLEDALYLSSPSGSETESVENHGFYPLNNDSNQNYPQTPSNGPATEDERLQEEDRD